MGPTFTRTVTQTRGGKHAWNRKRGLEHGRYATKTAFLNEPLKEQSGIVKSGPESIQDGGSGWLRLQGGLLFGMLCNRCGGTFARAAFVGVEHAN